MATSTLPQKPFHRLNFGEGIDIPERVYKNDSITLSVRTTNVYNERNMRQQMVDTRVSDQGTATIELQAAAFAVDGDRVQGIPLSILRHEEISWNALPRVSGNQKITFRIRGGNLGSSKIVDCPVRVNELDGLTLRQVQILGILFGALGPMLTIMLIIEVGHRLGLW